MVVAAVAAIFDPSTPDYDYLPFFYSRIFDLGWQVLYCQPCPAFVHAECCGKERPHFVEWPLCLIFLMLGHRMCRALA
jgi:hypothetical protein